MEEQSGDKKMSTLLLGSGDQFVGVCVKEIVNQISRYFYAGENILSKEVDNQMVALMTDNMYQVNQ